MNRTPPAAVTRFASGYPTSPHGFDDVFLKDTKRGAPTRRGSHVAHRELVQRGVPLKVREVALRAAVARDPIRQPFQPSSVRVGLTTTHDCDAHHGGRACLDFADGLRWLIAQTVFAPTVRLRNRGRECWLVRSQDDDRLVDLLEGLERLCGNAEDGGQHPRWKPAEGLTYADVVFGFRRTGVLDDHYFHVGRARFSK
jgi:hypothetical protein